MYTMRQFYSSSLWQRNRLTFLQSKNFVCNRCKGVAILAHHKIELTEQNVNDFNISLAWDNLEALCNLCHEQHHRIKTLKKGLYFDNNGDIKEVE